MLGTKRILKEINEMLIFIKEHKLIQKGYVCGYVNGLIWVRAKIQGEEPIFERDEVQVKRNRILQKYAKQRLDDMHQQLIEIIKSKSEKAEHGKHRNAKH